MRKRLGTLLLLLILATVALAAYDYFYVAGREIPGVLKINESTEIRLGKDAPDGTGAREVLLGEEGKARLKALLLDTAFRRVLANLVYFERQDQYTIRIQDQEQALYLNIHVIGNDYISIPDRYGGKHLKIHNPRWQEELEAILSLSQP